MLQAPYSPHLKTGDWRERARLHMADIKGHEVIFGISWLAEHNPRVDWRTGQLSLTIGGKEVELKPTSKVRIDGARSGARLSAMQVKRCLRKGDRVMLVVVTPVRDMSES